MQNERNKFLSKGKVWFFTILYILIWAIINKNIFYLPEFDYKLLLVPLLGSAIFYSGIENLRTGKGWIRGAPLKKEATIMSGWLIIIFSLVILFFVR